MPVSFLSEEQERRYGRYAGEPAPEQLARYFHLNDADRAFVAGRRGAHMRLGFAVQLGTVRFLGTFLEQPADVPAQAVAFMAGQLGIQAGGLLAEYATSEWRGRHPAEIRDRYGYQAFSEPFLYSGSIRQQLIAFSLVALPFWRCSRLDRPAGGVLPGAAFSNGLVRRAPAQDGVWAGAGGCFLMRGVWSCTKPAQGAKELKRTHPNPVPEGTSPAASGVRPIRRGRLGCGFQPVVPTRRPHPMQHHGQLARQRDLGLAEAAALGDPNGPGFQGAPAAAMVDQHVGCLIQHAAPRRRRRG